MGLTVDPQGKLRWSRSIGGLTTERTYVSARAKGLLRLKLTIKGKTYACRGASSSCSATMIFDCNGKAQTITTP
jgi:hypothetical protein